MTGSCEKAAFDIASVKSYRDIPGITDEEIDAIESLKESHGSFSFSNVPTIEAFKLPDGKSAGFSALFCELLSELFDIPFILEILEWDEMKSGIDSLNIDFTGDLTPTVERMQEYFMSHSIAERPITIFTYGETITLETENDLNGLRIGIFESTVTQQAIKNAYPELTFETIYVTSIADAVEKLKFEVIDVFVTEATLSDNPDIHSKEMFPLIYTPVSLATANPELEPIISAVSKYIAAGGVDKLYELYKKGKHEYAKFSLKRSLTDEEKAYLTVLAASGSKVPVALEQDYYPISFYNQSEEEFQGISVDILSEISLVTGIDFENITDSTTTWETILNKLRTGEIALVSELLYTEERKDKFLWSEPYTYSRSAIISKTDYPDLEIYQVVQADMGIHRGTAYDEMYNTWFPNNTNVTYYDSAVEMLDALEKGEIDLMLGSELTLLAMTHYREKSGYKSNITFNSPIMSTSFGFNINENILCSIISKAQRYVDTAKIERHWYNRVFDYEKKLSRELLFYISSSAAALFSLCLLLVTLFLKNSHLRERYKEQMITLSTIYNSLPDLIFCKNLDRLYTSCNKEFEKFAGKNKSEIIGKSASEVLFHSEFAARVEEKVFSERQAQTTVRWLTDDDGNRRLVEFVRTPLMQDGKIIGLLGIGRDITAYKKTEEEALAASKAKSDFLARMSHEIRTPMNAITGMAELALRERELDAALEHIFTIKQAGANLLAIINDILDFSKIETGKLDIIAEEYSFAALISDLIGIVRMKFINSQVRFAVNIDSNIPKFLIGDETRVRQIIINILSNAIKYTQKGYVSFKVSGRNTDKDTIHLTIEIADTGKGIKKENIENLFSEFVQFDAETNRGIEGTGLGLAITQGLVKAMDGTISVTSEYGKGSIFTVTLPQKFTSAEKLAQVENSDEKRIIVYERREIYAQCIAETISNFGLYCTLVSSDTELYKKMSTGIYNFMFISFRLYENNKETILKYGKGLKIVMLVDFGESIPDKSLNILAIPFHAVPIANILNGVTKSFTYRENSETVAKFTAPDARVLIVDDVNTNLKVADGLLSPYKMQVDLCRSGAQAIEMIQAGDYDLVFMDHRMPEMDGEEAMLRIRALEGEYYKKLPIVAFTANAVSEIMERLLSNGFDDFLSKPIDTVKMNSILEKWIPKEKQKKMTYRNVKIAADKKAGDIRDKIEIKGIDIDKGIEMTGGTLDNYLQTLAIFYKDGGDKLKEIRKCLATGNIADYTIYVHAMKSAATSIGADEISEAAKSLENAGRAGDLAYISTHTEQFAADLQTLLADISSAVPMKQDITI